MGRGGGGGGKGGGGGGRTGRTGPAGGGGATGTPDQGYYAGSGGKVIEGQGAPNPKITGDPNEVLEVRVRNRAKIEATKEIAAAERAAMNEGGLQRLEAYGNLPPVENANRVIRDGFVHVGDRGAPTVTPKLSNAEAMKRFERMGMPRDQAWENLKRSGDAPALVELFPEGSKYLGEGVEGVGIQLPGSKIALRIQHGGGQPLLQADVGRVGVYAEWMGKYGNTWVEAKESIAMQAKFMGRGNAGPAGPIGPSTLKTSMERMMKREGKRVHGVDDHYGNWGIDFAGRARVFDAGAYRPIGDNRVAAIWNGNERVNQVFTYTNKVKKK